MTLNFMLQRDPNSHKGQNGRVMVIGGNELFHGAPILASLGAEYSGVDLIFPFVPPCHAQVARTYSLNFILQTFQETHLTPADVKGLLNFSKTVDVAVVGPGLGSNPKTKAALKTLLPRLEIPTVVDASALFSLAHLPKNAVLTPHRGEFAALTGEEATPENVQKWAKNLKVTIVCKAPVDMIADANNLVLNDTGTAFMTIGGTGDLLAGFIAGLMAQGLSGFEAGKLATKLLGQAAENLEKTQGSLRAFDLAEAIPVMLHKES